MTIDAMRFMHGGGMICICTPNRRDNRRRVVTWHCLRVVDSIDAARAVLAHFDKDGITDAVAINPSGTITDSAMAARFFRVYYGMQ